MTLGEATACTDGGGEGTSVYRTPVKATATAAATKATSTTRRDFMRDFIRFALPGR